MLFGAAFLLVQLLLVSIAVPTARASAEDDIAATAAATEQPASMPADREDELSRKPMGPTPPKRFLAGLLRPRVIHDGRRKRSPMGWSDDANNRVLLSLLRPGIIHEGRRRRRSQEMSAVPAEQHPTDSLAQQGKPPNGLLQPSTLHDDTEYRLAIESLRQGGPYNGKRSHTMGGIYDQLLRPDIVHTGRRKRFLDSLAMARPIHSGKRNYRMGGIYDQLLRPDTIHTGKRRLGGIYDQLLRPAIIHTGRRKRFLDSLAMARPIHSGKRNYRMVGIYDQLLRPDTIHTGKRRKGGIYDQLLRPDTIHTGKRRMGGIYDQLLRPAIIHTGRRKRFLDSLAMARPIHSGKRLIDSVAEPRPIHQGRRKRLLDTLVRARPIYDGKRSG